MKFGKEFISQMVPEWQEAYMNYNHLKTHLKEIQRFKLRHKPPPPPPTGLKRKLTLYRAFSGLTQRIASPRSPSTSSDLENQAILVQSERSDGDDRYETMFLRAADEGGEVEATFIKHFSNSNRSKGMNILRPKVKRERHRITFSLGSLFGCSMALLIALILAIRTRNIIGKKGHEQYMVTLFPLYSLFGFITLHMLMYAGNIYYWRRYRVNYSFIFGFKEGTELGYREVLLLSFGVALLALASVHANLDMEIDPKTQDYKAITELVPMGLLVFLIVILFCPFNIIYRSSRFFLLACAFHCLCAPLYKVTLPDFFLADQLTSQVQAFRSLEFYVCYYFWGDYKLRQNTCMHSGVYNTFYFIVATIPFVSRLLQCLRRFYEEKDGMQGLNGLKYFITIVALCMRTAYSLNKGLSWNILAWIASAIAAVFSTYWDLVFDWGLLQKKSKNRWLRDKLLVPHKSVYFAAMVLNVLLRFVWLQTVLDYQVSFLHKQTLAAIVAVLEIIRRGIWSFFRLENEHLNNVGKYRAFNGGRIGGPRGGDDLRDADVAAVPPGLGAELAHEVGRELEDQRREGTGRAAERGGERFTNRWRRRVTVTVAGVFRPEVGGVFGVGPALEGGENPRAA
ncbi:hypothetical protein LOK49_LG03G00703 [Camellia lanceoleosa]|uniref:Uncharacterized protein n=1 Tax=Camellia lanceoleosa TaxID=1840588 RepID=A0ACC0IC39_9ERIC|nr:hypothetical protein LOK49_LG03G00703 [Camellia lanceoleosa]